MASTDALDVAQRWAITALSTARTDATNHLPNDLPRRLPPKDLGFGWGDLNPLHWLGSAASAAVGDVWKAAMTALWSAGLWVLGLAFKLIDAFTTPDLTSTGPLANVLPYTFGIGAFVAVLMAFVQIGVALFRRDGQSLSRVLVGVVQFGAVWIGYVAIAATLVTATAGLTDGLLHALLHVDSFAGFAAGSSWPTKINDTVVATVLGLCTTFILFPAAVGYVLIMLVREAALLILACTSPISAAGLLAEGTRSWFWRSLRWFIATLLIAPLAALVLGIGVQITSGTLNDPHAGDTAAQVGMAVTGCILILIGAICPLLLFRLLAFVDPGTSSGAAMRQSFAAHGGVAGVLSGKASALQGGGQTAGSGASIAHAQEGGSAGESTAGAMTSARFAGLAGGGGAAAGGGAAVAAKVIGAIGTAGTKAAVIGSDVLGSAGVGHQAPYFGQDSAPDGHADRGGVGSGDAGGALVPSTPMPSRSSSTSASASQGGLSRAVDESTDVAANDDVWPLDHDYKRESHGENGDGSARAVNGSSRTEPSRQPDATSRDNGAGRR